MIKKCVYRKEEFEIEFEWPLSEDVLNTTGHIRSFIDRVGLLPGTVILKKGTDIIGLIFSYKEFYELLRPFSAKGRGVQIVDEFKDFFSRVKSNRASQNTLSP